MKCATGTYFVKAHLRKEYRRANGTLVKATHVKAHCKKASSVTHFWVQKLKDSKPKSWPYRSEKGLVWTENDKESLLEAFEELPEMLSKMDTITGVFRMQRSEAFPNPATHGDDGEQGMLVLYDTAFDPNRPLARILAHELSHELYRRLPEIRKRAYRKSTGVYADGIVDR